MAAPGTKWQGWVRMKSADNPYAVLPPQSKYCLWVEADGEIWRCSILRGNSIRYEGRRPAGMQRCEWSRGNSSGRSAGPPNNISQAKYRRNTGENQMSDNISERRSRKQRIPHRCTGRWSGPVSRRADQSQ